MWKDSAKDNAYAKKRSTPRVQDSQAKTRQGRHHCENLEELEELEDLKQLVQHQRRQR